MILDLGLPGLDGLEVARALRAEDDVPILILTARDALESRVEGLDAGADDYLVKPFERQELLARMRALLRRRPPRGSAPLRVGDLSLNADTHEVVRGERAIELTQREFELLEYLMRNERIVISRQRLLDEVWGYDPFSTTNTIEVFVSNLRRKLEADGEPRLLHTIRGAGYVLRREPRQLSSRLTFAAPRRAPCGASTGLPIRTRLAGVSALLTFAILCGFAVAVGSLTVHRIREDFNREVERRPKQLPSQLSIGSTARTRSNRNPAAAPGLRRRTDHAVIRDVHARRPAVAEEPQRAVARPARTSPSTVARLPRDRLPAPSASAAAASRSAQVVIQYGAASPRPRRRSSASSCSCCSACSPAPRRAARGDDDRAPRDGPDRAS